MRSLILPAFKLKFKLHEFSIIKSYLKPRIVPIDVQERKSSNPFQTAYFHNQCSCVYMCVHIYVYFRPKERIKKYILK